MTVRRFELLPDPKRRLAYDGSQLFLQYFNFPKKPANYKRPTPFSPPCTWLCQKPLKRWHWTCLFCRTRRVYEDKLPNPVPVVVRLIIPDETRSSYILKKILLRWWFNVAEFLVS